MCACDGGVGHGRPVVRIVEVETAIAEVLVGLLATKIGRKAHAIDVLEGCRISSCPIDEGGQEVIVHDVVLEHGTGRDPRTLEDRRASCRERV